MLVRIIVKFWLISKFFPVYLHICVHVCARMCMIGLGVYIGTLLYAVLSYFFF